MKIAFVCDRINKIGGVERVLSALHQIWPQAPFYTAVYHSPSAPWAKDLTVKSSFLQHFPLAKTHHELYPWLTPLAFESFDFSDYDVVVSITSAEAKAVITPPSTLHLCYCLTPTRYLWSHQRTYLHSPGLGEWSWLAKPVFSLLRPYLQQLDLVLSSRPDVYLAISKTVQSRLRRYYHRPSQVVHPPVDFPLFSRPVKSARRLIKQHLPQLQPGDKYFLLVSRLVSYKNIALAIKAFNQLQQPLVIVGQGRQAGYLRRLAGPTIHFAGQVDDRLLISLYQHSQALIMPQQEDFGLVALESQVAGRPVIALNQGGVKDTVIPHRTGILFSRPTVDSLAQAVKEFNTRSWDMAVIKSQAKKFDQQHFVNQFKNILEAEWQKHQQKFL